MVAVTKKENEFLNVADSLYFFSLFQETNFPCISDKRFAYDNNNEPIIYNNYNRMIKIIIDIII